MKPKMKLSLNLMKKNLFWIQAKLLLDSEILFHLSRRKNERGEITWYNPDETKKLLMMKKINLSTLFQLLADIPVLLAVKKSSFCIFQFYIEKFIDFSIMN
jgi:hypothetical protein